MARGKHRLAIPVRLLAGAAAVLVIGGIVVATGTASANDADDGRARVVADPERARATADCLAGQVVSLRDLLEQLRSQPAERLPATLRQNDIQVRDIAADLRARCAGGANSAGENVAGEDLAEEGADEEGAVQPVAQEDEQDTGGQDEQNADEAADEEAAAEDEAEADANEEFPGRDQAGGPAKDDFIDIKDVSPNVKEPEAGSDGSTGSFTSICGTNEEGHLNSDNFMVAPGKVNGAQHVHDYVGNLSTDAFSDDESLQAAETTCALDDKSTYFWPVLRDTDGEGDDANEDGGGLDGNFGEILQAVAVDLEFRGNPDDKVTAMPEGLAVITGDAKAVTNGDANAKAAWTCTGFENRVTEKYPLCPKDSDLVRILDFPSCWDGENLDSANHRDHIVFPDDDGSCDGDFVAVPQLRMTLTYDRPDGDAFALDTFPEQRHGPITDHADFMNMMPDQLMELVVNCINDGQNC